MKGTTSVQATIAGGEWTFETGRLAGQADGAVVVTLGGETQVLATATASRSVREGQDFFPLTVDVEERMYAVGRIPGSFFRREGRASEQAILLCRLIDRPLRPAFPDGFRNEVHVVNTVLAVDHVHPHDIPTINASSAALMISGIPFSGPIGAVRMTLRDGEWLTNPNYDEIAESVFDLVVAGRRNESGEIDIMMVEAFATDVAVDLIAEGAPAPDEAAIVAGIEAAKAGIGALIDAQLELAAKVTVEPLEYDLFSDYTADIATRVAELATPKLSQNITIADKRARGTANSELTGEVIAQLAEEFPESEKQIKAAMRSLEKKLVRKRIIDEGLRIDGRGVTDIRPLSAEVGVVPRAHGSGLFQRGETQALNICTLGMLRMAQTIDTINPEESKRYMHNYNMPPFSTGEAGFLRGPKRREIGHGALAERALLPVVPAEDEFPYALRLVSEVLSSNGSTSMASVCASTLSMLDAGVPLAAPVAGIAMGLVAEGGEFATLTDILGAEDAFGDMDFKVAGTSEFITALQLDTKIQGLPAEVLAKAMGQARDARLKILSVITEAMPEPRTEVNPNAPRIETLQVPVDKIGEVIGPKGKTIQEITRETGTEIDIQDDGTILVGGTDSESVSRAVEWITHIVNPPMPEIGKEYLGRVVNLTDFGAFINILPGRDGLVHISKIGGSRRIKSPSEVLTVGDEVTVRVDDIDANGKVALWPVAGPEGFVGEPGDEGADSGPRERGDRDRDRGGRGGDRGGRGGDRGGRGGDRGGRGGDRGGRGGERGDRGGDRGERPAAAADTDAGDGGEGGDQRRRRRRRGGSGGGQGGGAPREGGAAREGGAPQGGDKPKRETVSFESVFDNMD